MGTSCARPVRQTKVLIYKNMMLIRRNWRNSLMQLLIPPFVVLVFFLLTLMLGSRAGENSLDHPNLDVDYTIGKIPRCTIGRGLDRCYTFAYNHADNAAVQAVISNVLSSNGLTASDVLGFVGANATQINAWLLNNVNTTQAAYIFNFDDAAVGSNVALFASSPYTLQLNYSVYIGVCIENKDFFQCPVVSRDIALPMQASLARAVMRLTGGTAPDLRVTTLAFAHPALEGFGIATSGPFFMVFALMFPMVMQAMQIVKEREVKLQYQLKLAGLTSFAWWTSWMLQFLVFTWVSYLLMIACGYACQLEFFLKNDFVIIFILFFIFGVAMTATVLLLSTVFLTVRNARLFVIFYLILAAMLGNIASLFFQDGASDAIKALRWELAGIPPIIAAKAIADLFDASENRPGMRYASIGSHTPVFPITQVYTTLLIDTCITLFFTWYFSNTLADIMGTRRPLYFFLTPSYWGCCQRQKKVARGQVQDESESVRGPTRGFAISKTRDDEESGSQEDAEDPDVVDERERIVQGNHKYAVVVDSLVKRFGQSCGLFRCCAGSRVFKCFKPAFQAVDGLSLGMEDNTLLCLLGPNGAGKTTTIHIMTGGLTGSAGEIFVRGRPMSTHGAEVRRGIGICPQFDVLWEELSGEENLRIFASLKDLSGTPVDVEVNERLQEVSLHEPDVRKRPAAKYSGGMKRRLCVAIALIGNPNLVFLDEPTTGMDPVSRREVWDIIERAKKGRAVILTTHSMEEADCLGDRIAIMAKGRLHAVGTSVHLKQRYGSGYRVVVLAAAADLPAVRQELQRDFPEAKHVEVTPVAFKLQVSEPSLLPALFNSLKGNSRVKDFQISLTTLEDVFLKIATESDTDQYLKAQREGEMPEEDGNDIPMDAPARTGAKLTEDSYEGYSYPDPERETEPNSQDLKSGRRASCCLQFGALLAKNFHVQKRKRGTNICQILLPCMLLFLILIFRAIIGDSADRAMELSSNPPAIPFPYMLGAYSYLVSAPSSQSALFNNLVTALPGVPQTSLSKGLNLTNVLVANKADAQSLVYSQWPSNKYAGGWVVNNADTTQRVLDVSLFFNRTNETTITTLPALFDGIMTAFMRQAGVPTAMMNNFASFPALATIMKFDIVSIMAGFVFPLVLFFQFPVYVGAIMHDKENKLIEIMRMMGMRMPLFWLTHAIFDMLLYLVVVAVVLIIGNVSNFTFFSQNAFLVYFLLFILWGLAMISLAFLFSTIFAKERSATVASYLFLLISFTIASVTNNTITSDAGMFFASLHPFLVLYRGVGYLAEASNIGGPGIHIADLPRPDVYLKNVYAYLAVEAVVYAALALYLEMVLPIGYGVKKHACFCFMPSYWRRKRSLHTAEADDKIVTPKEEVEAEAEEAEDVRDAREDALDPAQARDFAIRMVHLRKVYEGNVVATKNATFGIRKKEAFGLLGQNGAGKTTIASMLSGLMEPSSGNAYVGGYSIRNEMDSIYGILGVCPQHDLLWADMTAREHLMFFGRIKGLRGEVLKESVTKTLLRLNLGHAADRIAGAYSGGMKRRLSIGQALIGSPKVIFLDEPTTGLDPKNRRDIWKVISDATTQGDAAVVLTTHSMEEAEALCDRVGIMVAGRLHVVGTSAELKRRFSTGYSLTVNMDPMHFDKHAVEAAYDFVRSILPGAKRDAVSLGPTQKFHVPESSMRLDVLFRTMDREKAKYHIVDWAVSQTTLDDVFLEINAPEARRNGPAGTTYSPEPTSESYPWSYEDGSYTDDSYYGYDYDEYGTSYGDSKSRSYGSASYE